VMSRSIAMLGLTAQTVETALLAAAVVVDYMGATRERAQMERARHAATAAHRHAAATPLNAQLRVRRILHRIPRQIQRRTLRRVLRRTPRQIPQAYRRRLILLHRLPYHLLHRQQPYPITNRNRRFCRARSALLARATRPGTRSSRAWCPSSRFTLLRLVRRRSAHSLQVRLMVHR
jgi:hypothetical protein